MILYRILYSSAFWLLKRFRQLLPLELQNWIGLREQIELSLRQNNLYKRENVIWFHAASGEIEYCKSVIREIKKQKPHFEIIVSYSSPSAEKLFENIKKEVAEFIPICWDRPKSIQNLLNHYKPKALIFSRTDLWPELIHQASLVNIPLAVMAYNPRFGFLQNFLHRNILAKFQYISCVSVEQAQQLKLVLSSSTHTFITADGDTRFDQVFYRLSQTSRIEISSSQKIICFGSLWPEDEMALWPHLKEIKQNSIRLILSPHNVEEKEICELQSRLEKLNLSTAKLSDFLSQTETDQPAQQQIKESLTTNKKTPHIDFKFDVLLIDRIGFLADCYRFSSLAFVGGSFKAKVHSVMEPLCSGQHVLVGPYYQNSPEALLYLNKYVHPIDTKNSNSSLIEKINGLINSNQNDIQTEMLKNKMASQKVSEFILGKLLKNADS